MAYGLLTYAHQFYLFASHEQGHSTVRIGKYFLSYTDFHFFFRNKEKVILFNLFVALIRRKPAGYSEAKILFINQRKKDSIQFLKYFRKELNRSNCHIQKRIF